MLGRVLRLGAQFGDTVGDKLAVFDATGPDGCFGDYA